MNRPPMGDNSNISWFNLMKQAAQHKNIFVKISGLGICIGRDKEWNADEIKPCVEFVLDTFGVDRCFCGGDWPVSLLAGSYTQTWTVYKEVLSSLLSESDLKKVYDLNATSFYKL